MRKKCLRSLIFAAVIIISASCGMKPKIEVSTTEESSVIETSSEVEETEETEESREGMVKSYLTGLWVEEEIGRSRPVAVMLSNDKVVGSQSGINQAGIVYEIPVEGAMNRYLAIFEEYRTLKKIGSVRSARTCYVYFAKEYEAVLAHYGQSKFALPYLESKNCDNLNGLDGIGTTVYYRTSDRKAPHNAYTSGQGLLDGIAQKGYSMSYPDSYTGHFDFMGENGMNLVDGLDAKRVVPGYTLNKPWFEYNEADGLYYRFQYGGSHVDAEDQKQIVCKNIIIQYFNNTYYSGSEYLNIALQGNGIGKYITNGKAIDITWTKDSEWGITKYYDANSAEIGLNPGSTWICLVPSARLENLELMDE